MKPLKTTNGYVLLEVISALQKSIRRGEEREAMFWSMELIPRYQAYLWRRLTIITNEDIGIANPLALVFLQTQRSTFFEFREKGKDGACRLILGNTILFLCRSAKTRLADHFQRVVSEEFMSEIFHEIPDWAFDHHTQKGRRMGRRMEFFFEVGALLNPPSEVFDPYEDEAIALWKSGQVNSPDWGASGKANGIGKNPNEPDQKKLF